MCRCSEDLSETWMSSHDKEQLGRNMNIFADVQNFKLSGQKNVSNSNWSGISI